MNKPLSTIATKVFKEPGIKITNNLDLTKVLIPYEEIIERLTEQVNQWAAENAAEIIFIAYNSEKYYEGKITDSSYRYLNDRVHFDEITRYVYCTILYQRKD